MAFIIPAGTGYSMGTLTDGDYLTVSSPNIVGTVPMLVYTGSNITNTSNELADATGISFAVAASTDYWFCFWVVYQNSDALGVQLAVNGPASPTLLCVHMDYPQSLAAYDTGSVNAYNTPITQTAGPQNLDTFGMVEGIFRNGTTAGTLILRFAPVTGGGGTTMTIKANTMVFWQKI